MTKDSVCLGFFFIPGKDNANSTKDKSNWYAAPVSNNNRLFVNNLLILSNSPSESFDITKLQLTVVI